MYKILASFHKLIVVVDDDDNENERESISTLKDIAQQTQEHSQAHNNIIICIYVYIAYVHRRDGIILNGFRDGGIVVGVEVKMVYASAFGIHSIIF